MLKISELHQGVWQISEVSDNGFSVDAYLVAGTRRAMLVDTLAGAAGLYEVVRGLTALPFDVVLTHAHADHAGASLPEFAAAGCDIFMDQREFPVLRKWSPGKFTGIVFNDLRDGIIFDLGGRAPEIISVPGHTPGSLAVLDRDAQIVFTGDTIGSGCFWMQLQESLPLGVFRENLRRLHEITAPLANLVVLPGHRYQSPVELTGQYIADTLALTGEIIAGTVQGRPDTMTFNNQTIEFKHASRGLMTDLCYRTPEKECRPSGA